MKCLSKYLPSHLISPFDLYLTEIALSEPELLVNRLNMAVQFSKLDKEELEETSDPWNQIIFAKQERRTQCHAIIHWSLPKN